MAKRLTKVFLTCLLSLCSLLMLTGVSISATFTVNTTDDTVDVAPGNGICADSTGACSLRSAIMEANALSGADIIYLPSGRYVLALAPLDITGNLSLIGAGAETTIIDGDNKYQVFDTRATVTLSGVTVTKGYVGCGVGGGIINSNGALTITDSIITGNNANQCGSTGGEGGGIFNDGYYKNAQLTIINSIVSNNKANGSVPNGGGIFSRKVGAYTVTLTIINSTITGNSAGNWGGSGYGGGIANGGGTLEIRGSVISNNGAHSGGGVNIWQETDTITITDTTISGNTAWNQPGGWSGSGGGIFAGVGAGVGALTITNSTISGNLSNYGAEGGESAAGIHIDRGNVTIANSTVSGNNASRTDAGMTGGIINGGALTVINSTITNNRGNIGGIKQRGSTITLSNTIVANQNAGHNCSGTITSSGYNLASDGTCNLTATGDIPSGTANLGPLADNGGKTLTHALLAGSQAINAGNNATCANPPVNGVDQRGFSRLDGSCDIGAFEVMTLHTLNVMTAGTGSGYVTSSPGKIDCPDTCTDQIGENTVVTLTATPDKGFIFANFIFANWGGDCSGTSSTTTVTMNAAKTCAAIFDRSLWNQIPGVLDQLVVGDFNGDGLSDLAGLTSDATISGLIFYAINR